MIDPDAEFAIASTQALLIAARYMIAAVIVLGAGTVITAAIIACTRCAAVKEIFRAIEEGW